MDALNGKKGINILTNHWGQQASPTWRLTTTYFNTRGNSISQSLILSLKFYFIRRKFDAVVLGAGRSDIIFSIMQSLLPFKKVPCLMIDCLWNKNSNKLRYTFNKSIFQLINRSVDKFVVWAKHEENAFASTFNLPKDKFVFIPYHTTVETIPDLRPVDGDYIFSGGNSDRDYHTLIEAVKDLPLKVIIGTTLKEMHYLTLPENIEIKAFTHDEYVKRMAGCYINVVALSSGRLRSAGQQTFLNSMLMGKPTIVTDNKGTDGYIDNYVDGIAVSPGDPMALKEAILMLINNPEKAKKIGEMAVLKARKFSTEEHFKSIVALVEQTVDAKISCSGI